MLEASASDPTDRTAADVVLKTVRHASLLSTRDLLIGQGLDTVQFFSLHRLPSTCSLFFLAVDIKFIETSSNYNPLITLVGELSA